MTIISSRAAAFCSALIITSLGLSGDNVPSPSSQAAWTEQKIDIVIRDKHGRPANAGVQDVKLSENGKPLRVISVTPASHGAARFITYVIDGDSTLTMNAVLGSINELEKSRAHADVYVSLWQVSNGLHLVQNFTDDLHAVKSGLAPGAVAKPSGACPNAASDIGKACRLAPKIQAMQAEVTSQRHWRPVTGALLAIAKTAEAIPGRKDLLLFSTGGDFNNASDVAREWIVSTANRSEVSIYSVDLTGISKRAADQAAHSMMVLNAGLNKYTMNAAYDWETANLMNASRDRNAGSRVQLRAVAEQSGGMYSNLTTAPRKLTQAALEDSASFSQMAYEAPVEPPSAKFRSLDVVPARRDLRIQSRAGAFPEVVIAGKELSGFELPLLDTLRKSQREETIWFSGYVYAPAAKPAAASLSLPLSGLVAHELDQTRRFQFHISLLALLRGKDGQIIDRASRDVVLEGALENLPSVRKQSYSMSLPFDTQSSDCRVDIAVKDELANKLSSKNFDCSSTPPPVAAQPSPTSFAESNAPLEDDGASLSAFAVKTTLDTSHAPDAAGTSQLIDGAKVRVAEYKRTLPNFMCLMMRHRFVDGSGRANWQPLDTTSWLLTYLSGEERTLPLDPVSQDERKSVQEDPGANVEGEFGELLQMPFKEEAHAQITWEGRTLLRGNPMEVYRFSVDRMHSEYRFELNSQEEIQTAYHALVYVDSNTFGVRRIALVADNVPPKSFIRESELTVDYDYVPISGDEFLLPVHASLLVRRHGRALNRTELDFGNYRRYAANSTLVTARH